MKFIAIAFSIFLLTACGSSLKTAGKKVEENNPTMQNMEEKLLNGIDFYAKGETPSSWTLEIEFNKAIRFKSLDGTNIIASSVKPDELKNQQLVRFTTNTDKGNMVVNIYTENCSNEISNEQFNRKVTVEVNGKTYTGCGQFLYSTTISGKWVLDQWRDAKVSASDFAKGLPELELNPAENKLSGYDGCNKIFGDAAIWGSMIKFGSIASTKMACPGKKEINLGREFSSNTLSYKITNGQLVIYLPDDGVALFNKK